MPYTALVALVKVEVYGGAVNDVALFEQLHDLRVFGIAELRLEIIQLADGLVVQIALSGYAPGASLPTGTSGSSAPFSRPPIHAFRKSISRRRPRRPFVKAFYPIAFHLEAEVSLLHRVAELGRPGAWLRTPA